MELAVLKFAIFSSFLVAASIQDLRSRYISDIIWIIAAGILVPILIFEVVSGELDLLSLGVVAFLVVAITIPLNRIGYLGTADVFALILLSLYTPSAKVGTSIPLTPILVVALAGILSLGTVCINFARNLAMLMKKENIFAGFEQEPLHKKILAMLLGYRVKEVKGHYFALEKSEYGHRMFNFRNARSSAEFASGNDIWVTQALPFIVYITIAYVLTFLSTDLFNLAGKFFSV